MRLIEGLFVILIGMGMLAFGVGEAYDNIISNITSNSTLASGSWWTLENAMLGLIPLSGLVIVFAGVYIAIRGNAKEAPGEG